MRCVYCKSKNVELDTSSGMYYCHKCNRLLSPEEVDPSTKKSDIKMNEEYSDILYGEINATEATPIEEESLGIFTLILLGFLGGIPIFDFLSTAMVEWSNVSDAYKRTIVTRLISRIFTIAIVISLSMVGYKIYDTSYRVDIHGSIQNIAKSIHRIMGEESIEPELVSKSLEQIERTKSYQPNAEVVPEFYLSVKWSYIDGAIISGKTFLEILDDSKDGNLAYLVQTKQIVEKFDDKTYRNVGVILNQSAIEGANENYYYNGEINKTFSLMQDDYNEYITNSIEDLYSSKFIFYIKNESEFRFDILRAEDDSIIGFAITEVVRNTE